MFLLERVFGLTRLSGDSRSRFSVPVFSAERLRCLVILRSGKEKVVIRISYIHTRCRLFS